MSSEPIDTGSMSLTFLAFDCDADWYPEDSKQSSEKSVTSVTNESAASSGPLSTKELRDHYSVLMNPQVPADLAASNAATLDIVKAWKQD